MKVYHHFSDYIADVPLALSIGMFDGVHIGHQSIINQLNAIALNKNYESAILTFWPHPRLFFNPEEELNLLNSLDEKKSLLEQKGIQKLFLISFNEDFRNLSGEAFVKEILLEKLNCKYIIIGHDHVFGKNKSGDFALLEKLSKELDFAVSRVDAINYKDHNISSTKIRQAISDGNISLANKMLGYYYSISGKVIHGKKIGRVIGYPTANLSIDPLKLLPKNGAYIVEVLIDNHNYKGMLSIGTNPTVNGKNLSVEVYILDFDKEIYEKKITIRFRDFLHDEIAFESIEKLIERLDQDKLLTQQYKF